MQLAAAFTSTAFGVFDGLAHVQRLGQRQLIARRRHQIGKLDHHALALGRRQTAPAAVFKRRPGCRHCGVDVGFAAARHGGQQTAIDRRDAIKGLAVDRGHTVTIDEGAAVESGESGIGHEQQVPVPNKAIGTMLRRNRSERPIHFSAQACVQSACTWCRPPSIRNIHTGA
jgi:hypothetical protein